MRPLFPALLLLAALGGGSRPASAEPASAPEVVLTAEGEPLAAKLETLRQELRAGILRGLPAIDPHKTNALQAARAASKQAQADAAANELGKMKTAEALVGHAKGKWIGGADRGIAAAEAALKKATTDAERAAAQEELAHWQANRADGVQALAERQAALGRLSGRNTLEIELLSGSRGVTIGAMLLEPMSPIAKSKP
jgi:hypothetical protein